MGQCDHAQLRDVEQAQPVATQTSNTWQKLREGFEYVSSVQPICVILLLLALQSLVGISYMALLPVFAVDVLRGNATTMAALGTAGPIGSLLACLYLSLRRGVLGLERLIMLAQAAIGVGLMLFALSRQVWLSILVLVLVGGFGILQITSSNTIIQTMVEDNKRGRVMSFYALAMVGMMPFGNLLAGSLAQLLGAPAALIVCGSVCILGSLWFALQVSQIRRWIKRGAPKSVISS